MIIPDKYVVWVVDTKAGNFEIVRNSVPDTSHLEMRHIPTAHEFLEELRKRATNPESIIPHVIFMAFFLGETFANEIIPEVLSMFEAMPQRRPYVVAFSSMPTANTALLEIGADWDILKIKESEKIQEIADLIGTKDSIAKQLGHTQ